MTGAARAMCLVVCPCKANVFARDRQLVIAQPRANGGCEQIGRCPYVKQVKPTGSKKGGKRRRALTGQKRFGAQPEPQVKPVSAVQLARQVDQPAARMEVGRAIALQIKPCERDMAARR